MTSKSTPHTSGTANTHMSFFGENQEHPHLVWPVAQAADRVIATPPGQTPPEMGAEFFPDSLDMKERKDKAVLPLDTEHTYSFSYFSDQMALDVWKGVNIPGSSCLCCVHHT